MSLWMAVPLLIVILLVWVVVRSASGPSIQDTPEQILKRRYARGEIEREEYERRLNDLRK
jgi:putative membrane protein